MTNAQSYHYDRGQFGASAGDGQLQQTIFLSNNTSYPAFSSDVDFNSNALRHQPSGPTKNLMVGGANVNGFNKVQQQQAGQHRYSATGTSGQPKMPNLAQ